jgi:hypothetical protein
MEAEGRLARAEPQRVRPLRGASGLGLPLERERVLPVLPVWGGSPGWAWWELGLELRQGRPGRVPGPQRGPEREWEWEWEQGAGAEPGHWPRAR